MMQELQPVEVVAPVPAGRWIVASLGEVAEFLGVEVSTIWGWRGGANPMPGEQGNWDLQAITQWRCERLKANSNQTKSKDQAEVELAILRQDLLKKELANRMKAGELVARVAAAAKVAEMFNESRMGIEAIPELLGPMLPPEIRTEATIKIAQTIKLILRKMAQKSKGCIE